MKQKEPKPKRRGRLLLTVLIVLAVLAALAAGFYRSQAPAALRVKKYIKYDVLHLDADTHPRGLMQDAKKYVKYNLLRLSPATEAEETQGLADYDMTLYVDGRATTDYEYDEAACMDRVYRTADVTRLVAYHDGYQLDFPENTEFDFSRTALQIVGKGDGFQYTVSREYSPYAEVSDEMTGGLAVYAPDFPYEDGVDQYIGFYQCRFLLNKDWQENNRVSVTEPEVIDAGGHRGVLFHAVIRDVTSGNYDAYSYAFLHCGGQDFLRVVVKYHAGDPVRERLPQLLATFRTFTPHGATRLETDFHPVEPDAWTTETKAMYEEIANATDVTWGVYTANVSETGIQETIPHLEEQLDYTFGVILEYNSMQPFPTEFMEENRQKGRMVELTYHLTEDYNTDMRAHSPLLDIYRGEENQALRDFARAAKDYGHPFLFRLCNEMNSDWTSYGGVNNMADPEVFATVWRTVYEIFRQEGVGNCIWIFNPNDRNCPPSKWNDGLNYYPGNEYVQMLGITGYNNGTYYTQWAEQWREFDVIYDAIQAAYGPTFGDFPWIITEFASSSYGGDKAAWIENMFRCIGNYPNIKIAVWYSNADLDENGVAARPYWLDETPDTLAAFKRGLHENK